MCLNLSLILPGLICFLDGVFLVMDVKAVLFDLHGTLAHCPNRMTDTEISDYLLKRGYEVSSQTLRAAWSFVALVDYPRHGYKDWKSFFSRVFHRLDAEVDERTLESLVELLEATPYQLLPDAARAVIRAKEAGFRTSIVTTIARFQFSKAIEPIEERLDFVMTGYEAGCDKSNPKMYLKVLEVLGVEPGEAVMIGDELHLDIVLPKKLGIRTVLLDRERRARPECGSVDAFVYDLDNAMEIVISWHRKKD
jgi:putative hydrolase of the HAD superfamily